MGLLTLSTFVLFSGMPDFSTEVGSNIFLSCVRCENVTTIDHNSLDCFKVEQNSRKRKKKVSSCKLESTTLVSLPFCCSLSSIQCYQLIIFCSESKCFTFITSANVVLLFLSQCKTNNPNTTQTQITFL